MKRLYVCVLALAGLSSVACKSKTVTADKSSGLYSLNVSSGTPLSGDAALTELNKYCGAGNLDQYLARIANQLSFNAGYAEHPNAGYDAPLVKKVGPDGVEAYYIGEGQMYDGGDNMAMFPPTNGSISRLVASYCAIAVNSLSIGGGTNTCAYPQIEVTSGGSVTGNSASGSINGASCITAKMSNSSIQSQSDLAFCPDSLGGNFKTTSDGAAGEMSIIIRSGG